MYYIKEKSRSKAQIPFKILAYTVCIILTVLCIFPFVVMIINSTRSTPQIQQHAISLIPSKYFMDNLEILTSKTFDPLVGFGNSLIISIFSTACTIYFSTMTAFAIVAYDWKLKNAFFTLIMCVLMIPTQVTCIGFYQFIYKIGMTNSYLPLILPAIAAPSTVFFMRQYMVPTLPMEILQSARIDGAGEFRIFNQIVLPMMIFSSSCYADMEMKRFTTILTPLSLSIMLSLYLVPLCVVNLAHSPSTSLPLLARIRNDF